MAVPKYSDMYASFLSTVSDGQEHTVKEIREKIAVDYQLTEEDLAETFQDGKSKFANRVGWTRTYLIKAGLIESPKRSVCVITKQGKKVLESGKMINNAYLASISEEFSEFIGADSKAAGTVNPAVEDKGSPTETPAETLEKVYSQIKSQLADDLMTQVLNMTPNFFEKLVVDLMEKMNYGGYEGAGLVTKATNDGGIDGIINEDKLGFNQIYIQAKRWNPSTVISKPEIQKFVGALAGPPKMEKGLYITTAKFSKGAEDYAKAQHVILVDGKKLADLMIEYQLGVSTEKVYEIKHIDTDYFSEDGD